MKVQTIIIFFFLCASTVFAQQPDSVTLSGSPEIGNMRNLLIERIQYKEGTFLRNDFVRDYSPFDQRTFKIGAQSSFDDELSFRDAAQRNEIALSTRENTVSISFLPLLGGTVFGDGGGKPFWKRSSGLETYGSIGENFVFYAKAIDNIVRQRSPDMQGSLSSQPAYVTSIAQSNGYDYDDTEMQFGFRLGLVHLYFEKIRNTWGYGRGGQVVLSGRAPSYPQIRASIQLLHNLKFTAFAGFLNSGVVDSNLSYTDYTDGTLTNYRIIYRSKYIFAHVLEYSPINEMNLAVGEEMIVSDRFTPEYVLLPISFYHNLYIQGGGIDQTNIWGGGRYTYPNLGSLYGTLYVDDFNFNQGFYVVAGTIGGTLVDIDHRKLDLTLEYTALRPFVYANNQTALYRTSNGYPLGDWLGQNAERLQMWLDYRPIPQLWLSASYVVIRKGMPGTEAQEYGGGIYTYMTPVPFLGGPLFKRNEFDLNGRWEMWSGLFADITYRLITQSDPGVVGLETFSGRSFASFSMKLNIFGMNDEW